MDARSLALVIGSTALAAVAPAFLQGAQRTGVIAGLITAVIATTIAFVLVTRALRRDLRAVLGAVAFGFLARMLLVAVALLVCRSIGGDLLAFTAAFFGLFLLHQVVELSAVVRVAQKAEVQAPVENKS